MKYSVVFPAGCPFAAFLSTDYTANTAIRGVYRIRTCVQDYNTSIAWCTHEVNTYCVESVNWFDAGALVSVVDDHGTTWTVAVLKTE